MNFDFLKNAFNAQGTKTLSEMATSIINWVLVLLGIIALAYIIYGGVMFITSAGESDKVTNARNTLLYAIIGIIVIVLAFAIVNWAATFRA